MTKRRGAAAATLLVCAMAGPASAAPALTCAVEAPAQSVPAGQPVLVRFTVTNPGPATLQMLRWNTPFEGRWFAPFVDVQRDGKPVRYRGPMVKRGDPRLSDYLTLQAGASHSARVDIAQAFDLAQPGQYRVRPRIVVLDLFDAQAGPPPRPRSAHAGVELACPEVDVRVG